jgi:hypothetical protein
MSKTLLENLKEALADLKEERKGKLNPVERHDLDLLIGRFERTIAEIQKRPDLNGD